MFVADESVNSTGSIEPPGSTFRTTGGAFVLKSEPNDLGLIPGGPVESFHQLHNVIITAVSSPAASPLSGASSPAASPSPMSFELNPGSVVSTTHTDLDKFNRSSSSVFQLTSSMSSAGCLLQNSLPPPPLPSTGRVLTPRTDPTGCEENGITLLGNKYILLDQLEGSNLRRCIHVDSHENYVCKVTNLVRRCRDPNLVHQNLEYH